MDIIIIIFILLCYVSIGFLTAVFLKRNDIADVMWGPGIFLSVFTAYILTQEGSYVILLIVFLWALRIFLHIGKRFINKQEEDFRYASWRKTWKYFYTRSFFQVFLLQGFLMFLVSSSVVFLVVSKNASIPPIFWIGVVLSCSALLFETIADRQLESFLKQKTGGIMQTGLWKYSRHPNYFGEVLFWWGIFLTTISYSYEFFVNPLSLISPIVITYLILFVSGIPMLEKKYDNNEAFQIYKSKTNAFFPWFPKNAKDISS